MTDDEIQAAYDETVTPPYEHACWLAFARRIAEIERKECAVACESAAAKWRTAYEANIACALVDAAAAIRARGGK